MLSFELLNNFEPISLPRTETNTHNDEFPVNLHNFSNNLIYEFFPYVASLTLDAIDNELEQVFELRKETFKKLKNKYKKGPKHVNIIHDIIIEDYEKAVTQTDVQLIPNSHASLIKSSNQNNLIQIIIKQIEEGSKNKPIDKEIKKIGDLLKFACNYKFTYFNLKNNSQEVLDEHKKYRIIQVCQIFQQYFKQFNYIDYLKNYKEIKDKIDINSVQNIIKILIEIGTISC